MTESDVAQFWRGAGLFTRVFLMFLWTTPIWGAVIMIWASLKHGERKCAVAFTLWLIINAVLLTMSAYERLYGKT